MKRTECGGCLSPNLVPILNLGHTPLGDQFPATLQESRDQSKYPLVLLVCEACRLVQLEEIVSDEILFGADYGFYSGTSKAILKYYDEYAQWISDRYPDRGTRILEIACNDGGLLEALRNKGFNSLAGVDPASGPAKAASDKGFQVDVAAFGSRWGAMFHGCADLIVANHVVAHNWDLHGFLSGVHDALAPGGDAVIEFQYLPDLLVGNMFDHVYHEHRYFFSVASFRMTAMRFGLFLASAEWVDRQGGSMRVILTKKRNAPSITPLYDERWLASWDPYESLQGRAEHVRTRLLDLINPAHGILAGYGAPAKATTLLNFCELSKREISWVVDTTPTKIGKFMPGTDIPIINPNSDKFHEPHQYLLLVWNYVGEIIHKETEFLRRGGHFIVPIPYPTVI